MKKRKLIIAIGLTLGGILLIACFTSDLLKTIIVSIYSGWDEEVNWKETTTPLSVEVQEDLCSKFAIDVTNQICDTSTQVYAREINKFLFQLITEEGYENWDYARIHEILKDYEAMGIDWIYPEEENEKPYFIVRYDFNKDLLYGILFFFTDEGTLTEIRYQ